MSAQTVLSDKFHYSDVITSEAWTSNIDHKLQEIVTKNYFNFDLVAIELANFLKKSGYKKEALDQFNSKQCRLRWFNLHYKRKLEKDEGLQEQEKKLINEVSKNKQNEHSNSQTQNQRGEHPEEHKTGGQKFGVVTTLRKPSQEKEHPATKEQPQQKTSPEPMSNPKVEKAPVETTVVVPATKKIETSVDNEEEDDKEQTRPLTFEERLKIMEKARRKEELYSSLVKNRKNVDFLDVSNEDFSKNKTMSIDGKEITPSNFNIFRDNLHNLFEQMTDVLKQNLPDMNTQSSDSEESEDEEIVPLDFRTAMLEKSNKVVIQVKPMNLKKDEDFIKVSLKELKKPETLESYLDIATKESFKNDEEGLVLLEPDVNLEGSYDNINLECNKVLRINNSINSSYAGGKTVSGGESKDNDSTVPEIKKGEKNLKELMVRKIKKEEPVVDNSEEVVSEFYEELPSEFNESTTGYYGESTIATDFYDDTNIDDE